jgi:hypothetical protein
MSNDVLRLQDCNNIQTEIVEIVSNPSVFDYFTWFWRSRRFRLSIIFPVGSLFEPTRVNVVEITPPNQNDNDVTFALIIQGKRNERASQTQIVISSHFDAKLASNIRTIHLKQLWESEEQNLAIKLN